MKRISTATADLDKWGAGKNGFKSETAPGVRDGTQLDANWFDEVQEEVANCIEAQGGVLDGLNFFQLKEAIDAWGTFSAIAVDNGGTFTMKDASTLVVEGDTGNGGSTLRAENTATVELLGSATCGTTAADTWVFASVVQANENVTLGTDNTNTATLNGNVVVGLDGASVVTVKGLTTLEEGATIPATKDLTLVGDASVVGTATSSLTAGQVVFLSGGPALSATSIGINVSDELFYGPSDRIHASLNGWVYATGDQEAETAMAVSTIAADTSEAVLAVGNGLVRVIVEGWGQRASVGDVEIDVQQDQGTATWIDIGAVQTVEWVDTLKPSLWSPFRHERTLNAGTVNAIFYRLKIDGSGGTAAKIRETNLRVVSER